MGEQVNQYYFEIYTKGKDFRGLEIKEELKVLGFENIDNVLASKIYLLNGDIDGEAVKRIAEELLIDPVSESYFLESRFQKGVQVKVYFKPGVLDLESKRVLEALEIMGIEGIESAQTVRKYIIDGEISEDDGEYISGKLLYNKVIEKVEIESG
jgi:phosphoribosylformylglycinamidine (FGAM) synthase PurS component